jgi:hypothetical protein
LTSHAWGLAGAERADIARCTTNVTANLFLAATSGAEALLPTGAAACAFIGVRYANESIGQSGGSIGGFTSATFSISASAHQCQEQRNFVELLSIEVTNIPMHLTNVSIALAKWNVGYVGDAQTPTYNCATQ